MIARTFMVVLLLVVSGRFALLAWAGYRNGRVKSASPWSRYWDRQMQPRFYWAFMGAHLLVIVTLVGCAFAIILGLAPISN